jgi:hypothetical protein
MTETLRSLFNPSSTLVCFLLSLQPGQDEEGVTSAEFDKFLAERAAAVDTLPNVPDDAPPPSENMPPRPSRQLKDEQENAMFAL